MRDLKDSFAFDPIMLVVHRDEGRAGWPDFRLISPKGRCGMAFAGKTALTGNDDAVSIEHCPMHCMHLYDGTFWGRIIRRISENSMRCGN